MKEEFPKAEARKEEIPPWRQHALEIFLTDGTSRFSRRIVLDGPIKEALRPLPVNREIPWEFREREIAAQQKAARKRYTEFLSKVIASELIALIESQDTQNGYPMEGLNPNVAMDEIRDTLRE